MLDWDGVIGMKHTLAVSRVKLAENALCFRSHSTSLGQCASSANDTSLLKTKLVFLFLFFTRSDD